MAVLYIEKSLLSHYYVIQYMKAFILLFLSLSVVLCSLEDSVSNMTCDSVGFEVFKSTYSKAYPPEEEKARYDNYISVCQIIAAHNAESSNSTYTMTINQFADEYASESSRRISLKRGGSPVSAAKVGRVGSAVGEIPLYLDYKKKGYVTAVKDQGSCGSCWAFAATAVYESKLLMYGHNFILSEEAPLQCTDVVNGESKGTNSCEGGYVNDVMKYYLQKGGLLQSDYPYVNGNYYYSQLSSEGICDDSKRFKIGSGNLVYYQNTLLSDEEMKQILLDEGPIMVAIYANTEFQYYSSGVFDGCGTTTSYYTLNHAVLLYGWDSSGNWLIKNSWGNSWGENGFMRLDPTRNCGISKLLATIHFTGIHETPYIDINKE